MTYYKDNKEKEMPASAPTETSITKKDVTYSHTKNCTANIIAQKNKNMNTNCKFYEIDIFSQVKNCLEISQVLEYYGVQINSRGFALCPFHQENTPSFKVYDDNFYCFGCGESGTVIDFVVKYFRLTNIEAAKKLSADFGLNLYDCEHTRLFGTS